MRCGRSKLDCGGELGCWTGDGEIFCLCSLGLLGKFTAMRDISEGGRGSLLSRAVFAASIGCNARGGEPRIETPGGLLVSGFEASGFVPA